MTDNAKKLEDIAVRTEAMEDYASPDALRSAVAELRQLQAENERLRKMIAGFVLELEKLKVALSDKNEVTGQAFGDKLHADFMEHLDSKIPNFLKKIRDEK